ncbi:MAG: HDOD domain-containing protein [Proteobacteria bacterium]|nr:HDOD domain-containing protein [Pseudomonadota bacterium]
MDIEEIIKSMEASIMDKDKEILADIENKTINGLRFGFAPEVMGILDDMDAPSRKIESIKDMLHQNVALKLYGIGNSVYYSKIRKGNMSSFLEIVLRLGTEQTKTYILMFTLLEFARSAHIKKMIAKNIATSIMAKIIAREFGFAYDNINKAELGGLVLEIGKMIVIIYQEKEKEKNLDNDFSEKFNVYLGLKIIKHFGLPDYLINILLEDVISFDEKSFSVSTIVNIANLLVSHSFNTRGKLFLKIPLSDRDGIQANQYSEMVVELFRALGLDEYIETIEAPAERQKIFQPER